MKGLVIHERIYEGMLDFGHGGGHDIYRIIIPEANDLNVFIEGPTIHVSEGFSRPGKPVETVMQIEVPDAIVEKLQAFRRLKQEILDMKSDFATLLPEFPTPKFKKGDRCVVTTDQPNAGVVKGMKVTIQELPTQPDDSWCADRSTYIVKVEPDKSMLDSEAGKTNDISRTSSWLRRLFNISPRSKNLSQKSDAVFVTQIEEKHLQLLTE